MKTLDGKHADRGHPAPTPYTPVTAWVDRADWRRIPQEVRHRLCAMACVTEQPEGYWIDGLTPGLIADFARAAEKREDHG